MAKGTKIATCCYCGSRTALVLRGKDRHELSCASCGAPLHEMKMLRSADVHDRPVRNSAKKRYASRDGVTPLPAWERRAPSKSKYRKKKRKGLAQRFFEEAFDVIEDIFD